MTSFHHCAELRFSHAQGCQPPMCGPRFHCMILNLCHQSCRTFSRDRVAKDCDFVNVFLPSATYCRFGYRDQIPCCTFQWKSRILALHLFSSPNVCKVQPVWGQTRKSHARRSVSCCIFFFRIGLFLPSNTNFTCIIYRGVLTVLVSTLHPDSSMMRGACLQSNSMSKNCPV